MSSTTGPPHWHSRPASSYAYFYPLKGIAYLARNRYLWPLLRSRLIPVTLLSTATFGLLLTFGYLPQALLLVIFHGRAGFFNALILVLGECAALTQILFEAFFVDETLVDAFDSVLVARGKEQLVLSARPVFSASEGDPKQRLGRPTKPSTFSPFSIRQIIELILLLPLTLIPWAGVPLFLWGTGYRAGPLLQHRYFELKDFTKQEKKAYIRNHRRPYTGFGVTAMLLQLIPVLSMGFLFTTAVGSALWAAAVEDERIAPSAERAQQNVHGTLGRHELGPGEAPPPYSEDDPV